MDLSTSYLGLTLKNPLVPSSSPLCADIGKIKALEDAGASAVVLHSLFEEQIIHDTLELNYYTSYHYEWFPEALSYFPEPKEYHLGPEEYLEHIGKVKEAVDIPVIASLNGVTTGGWLTYAEKIAEAGADALELNAYYIATNPKLPGTRIEALYLDILREVKQRVRIPVAMKLNPCFSSTAAMARALVEAGADGLVLFNRFYQPDFDLENLEVVPQVTLSTSDALRLPLRWVAILSGRIPCSLAVSSGIHTAEDALKALLAGADVTMLCSALLRNGISHLGTVLRDMETWMERKEYTSVSQLKGSMSQKSVEDPAAFERANYMKALHSFREKAF
ncbi:MAG: dihydroorotate dehydrogenase-like protein [bacterium]